MKTAAEIKSQIKQLEAELVRAEATDGYLARIEKCAASGAAHKWRVDSFEINIEQEPVYMWGRMNPVSYEVGRRTEKAQLRCFCGVSLTFQEG